MSTQKIKIDPRTLRNYFGTLIDRFFKILPIWESGEGSITKYMQSLQAELLGFKGLDIAVQYDARLLSLIAILQFFIDNPGSDISHVKREVFRAISICEKLRDKCTVSVREVRP